MRTILIFVLIASLISMASGERGIVIDSNQTVLYKFDTETTPTLQPGENIISYEDINSIQKGAKYQGGVFINPAPELPQTVEIKIEPSKIDPTQTIISGLAGAGAAYLIARRKP